MLAFVVAWVIQFSLGLVLIGFSSVLLVNFFYAIGGGQWAPLEELTDTFLSTLALNAPGSALFVAFYVLISLFVAGSLVLRYPRNRYSAYAFSGAVVPLAIGLIAGALNWVGALVGAVSMLPAAKLMRSH